MNTGSGITGIQTCSAFITSRITKLENHILANCFNLSSREAEIFMRGREVHLRSAPGMEQVPLMTMCLNVPRRADGGAALAVVVSMFLISSCWALFTCFIACGSLFVK